MTNRPGISGESLSTPPSPSGGSPGVRKLEWVLALILLGFILTISFTGWRYYRRLELAAARTAETELNAIADLKLAQLTQWRQERQSDAEMFLEAGVTRLVGRDFLHNPQDEVSRERLVRWMETFQRHSECTRVVLLDTNLLARISVPEASLPLSPEAARLATSALASKQVLFSELHLDSTNGPVNIDCFVPMLGSARETSSAPESLAVFLLEFNAAKFLFPLLQTWPTPSQTGETLLLGRDGKDVLYLNELRHRTNTALRLRLPVQADALRPATMAIQGNEGIQEGLDYRGHKVLAALRQVPNTPWSLVAKQDLAEIYAPLEKQAWIIGEMVGAVILAASLGVVLVWRNREHQFSLRELAERKQAQEALRQSAERFAGFTAATFEGIGMSQNGRHLDVNDQYLALFGYTREEVIGHEISEFVAPESREQVAEAIQSGREAVYEHLALRKDGTTFFAESRSQMLSLDGRPVRVTALRDITERKQAEAERERLMQELLRKNKELESVIYVSSHDLRSPLVNIQGFSYRLRSACEEIQRLAQPDLPHDALLKAISPLVQEKIVPSLGFIIASAVKMDGLLNGLLRLSRLGRAALSMQGLDMNKLAHAAVSSLAYQIQQAGAQIEVGDLPSSRGDATQISQVLSNLLDNALKYRHPERPPVIVLSGQLAGQQVRYCLKDNGLGIPTTHQEKVWEIFQRMDPTGEVKGDGLGLAIVRRILDRHGGRAWLESQPGLGTSVYFELPAAQPPAREATLNPISTQ